MKIKKILSGILTAAMLLGSVTANAVTIESDDTPKRSGAAVEVESSGDTVVTDYGLADSIENGTILHAFAWNMSTLKENMKLIAESGYTAVQTSPVSLCDGEGTPLVLMGDTTDLNTGVRNRYYSGAEGAWWWHYQPLDLKVGNYQLFDDPEETGVSYIEQYKAVCDEADKYGIKIITDIVANHTAKNNENISNDLLNAVGGITNNVRDYSKLYHKNWDLGIENRKPNYNSRFECTYYNLESEPNIVGLRDINTENPLYQAYLVDFLNTLIEAGCDGFRFDTAKHIALPTETFTENGYSNTFWTVVNGGAISVSDKKRLAKTTDGQDLFIYGEILDGPYADYDDYIKFASDDYGSFLRKAVLNTDGLGNRLNSTKMSSTNWGFSSYQPYSDGTQKGIVTWVESHDTYYNDHPSASMSAENVRFAWAIAAARQNGTPLFFNRPYGSTNDSAHYFGKNQIGIRGDDQFFHPEVVAVNKFRNAMVGENETMRNINTNNKILQIDRGTKGTCIINIDSQGYDINTYTNMADGTYYDSVTGNEFRVENNYITGHINAKSIATIYDTVSLKLTSSKSSFTTDTVKVKATIANGSNGTYDVTVDNVVTEQGNFTSGTAFEIGNTVNPGDGSKEFTVSIHCEDNNGKLYTKHYTFTKRNPSDINYVYFDNKTRNWSSVSAYIYGFDDEGCYHTNGDWPGQAMTYDAVKGLYRCEVPYNLKNGKVVFYGGSSTNRYPGNNQEGLLLDGTNQILNSSNELVAFTNENTDQINAPSEGDSYVYFFNYTEWKRTNVYAYLWESTDASNCNATYPGQLMTWSDTFHCFYCKYDSDSGFDKVIFSTDRNYTVRKTDDLDIEVGKIYFPYGSKTVSSKTVIDGSWNDLTNIKSGKVYFENDGNWSNVNVYMYSGNNGRTVNNADWPGAPMTYCGSVDGVGDNLYCYTYYYPNNSSIYDKIFFMTADQSSKVGGETGLTFAHNSAKPPLYNSSGFVKNIDVSPDSEQKIDIYFNYTDRVIGKAGTQDDYTRTAYRRKIEVGLVNQDRTLRNIDDVVTEGISKFSPTNLYDNYVFSPSQLAYVSNYAYSVDKNNNPYCSYIEPTYFDYQTEAFSSTTLSSNYKSVLQASYRQNRKWVTYHSTDDFEISGDGIAPDLSNVGYVEVWGTNLAQKYSVNLHYPTSDADFDGLKEINSVIKTKADYSGVARDTRYYAELIDETKTLQASRMHIKQGYVFDGWYCVSFDDSGAVEGYYKLSSSLNYRARVTQDLTLYAAFRTANTAYEEPIGASVLSSGRDADVYSDSSGSYYRLNTMLNIVGCKPRDSAIEKVGVVYVKSPSNAVTGSAVKTAVENAASAKGTFTVGGSECLYFTYSASDAGLTSHNRTQFTLNVKEQDVADGEKYETVRVYTVFKRSGTWYISDNSVEFENGVPRQGYLLKN